MSKMSMKCQILPKLWEENIESKRKNGVGRKKDSSSLSHVCLITEKGLKENKISSCEAHLFLKNRYF